MTAGPKLYLGSTLVSGAGTPEMDVIDARRTSSTDATPPTVSVSPNATANTKGTWVELIASTPADSDGIQLLYNGTGVSAGSGGALCDIAVGASGSEVVLVANVALAHSPTTLNVLEIPVRIASGLRVSVRWQSARAAAAAATFGIGGLLKYPTGTGVTSVASIDTIGANTAASSGVALGTTSTTFVEVTSSTSRRYRGVVVSVTSTDTTFGASLVSFDLGIGAGGVEVAHLSNVRYQLSTAEALTRQPGGSAFVPADIPAGSRLAVRVIDPSASGTAYSVVLLGVPA